MVLTPKPEPRVHSPASTSETVQVCGWSALWWSAARRVRKEDETPGRIETRYEMEVRLCTALFLCGTVLLSACGGGEMPAPGGTARFQQRCPTPLSAGRSVRPLNRLLPVNRSYLPD